MKHTYGWTGRILTVDLTGRTYSSLPTEAYCGLFIGGLGIAEKIYWDLSSPGKDAFHPDSPLIIMTGPLCGTAVPGAPRLAVCGKSPATFPERFVWASAAGFFPATLKKAGYDGIVLLGKADRPVYISIADGSVTIHAAARLWGSTVSACRSGLEGELGAGFKVMAIGPGAEHGSRIGTLSIDLAGSTSMGFGSVMGSKNCKAIAVRGSGSVPVADPDRIRLIRRRIKTMRGPGYYNLYGSPVPVPGNEVVKKVHCHGCTPGCWRTLQRRPSGLEGIRKCQTATYYAKWDKKLHGAITDTTFLATDLANDYSLCILELLFIMLWLDRCRESGILTEDRTRLPLSQMGSLEFIETLIDRISFRKGFGEVLAEGALRASDRVGPESREITRDFLNQTGRPAMTYGPKSFILSGPVFAVEQRPSITTLHEICSPLTKWALWLKTQGTGSYLSTEVLRKIAARFWGGEIAVDFSTYAGKALAALLIQNRQFAKECLILCDLVFPMLDDASTEDHVGDPTLESSLLSAVTGQEMSEAALSLVGERVFTLNRAIQLRDGRTGRADDRLPDACFIEREEPPADIFDMYNPDRCLPGKGDQLIFHKKTAVDKQRFEELMDEYYFLRGWDVKTGVPVPETLQRLELDELIGSLM